MPLQPSNSVYCKNAPQTNIEAIKAKCTEAYEYIPNGIKNGLDFQLVTYLGSNLCDDCGFPKDDYYYIVSADKGFGSAVHFCESNDNDISVRLLSTEEDFCKAFFKTELQKLNLPSLIYDHNNSTDIGIEEHEKLIEDSLTKVSEIISAFFEQPDKEHLNNEISRIVRNNEICKEIYRLVRPLFRQYQKAAADELQS